jgi:hypothetical protein
LLTSGSAFFASAPSGSTTASGGGNPYSGIFGGGGSIAKDASSADAFSSSTSVVSGAALATVPSTASSAASVPAANPKKEVLELDNSSLVAASSKMSSAEQQKNKELLTIWESRLREQAKSCDTVAEEAIAVDVAITSSAAKLQDVRIEQVRLRSKQEAADHTVHLIWDQQDTLSNLLAGLQSTLEGRLTGSSAKPEARAQGLSLQLDELERQIKDLSQETQNFQAHRYSEPLVRVGHVLDAHSSELDSIEECVTAAFQRLHSL